MPCASSDEKKLTWQEIKTLIESSGVRAEDEIDISWGSVEDLECKKDEDFGWQIRL